MRLTVKARLRLTGIGLAILALAVLLYTATRFAAHRDALRIIYEQEVMQMQELSELSLSFAQADAALPDLGIAAMMGSPADVMQKRADAAERRLQSVSDSLQKILKSPADDVEQDSEHLQLIADFTTYRTAHQALASIAVGGDVYGASEQRPAALQQAEQVGAGFARELAKRAQRVKQGYDEAAEATTRDIWLLSGIAALTFFFLIGGMELLGRTITRPLSTLVAQLHNLGRGDLRGRLVIDGSNEVMDASSALNATLDRLSTLITEVQQTASSLAETSIVLLDTSEQTQQELQGEASELNVVNATSTQMSSAIAAVAQNAVETADAARSADSTAVRGTEQVNETIAAIGYVSEGLDTARQQVESLADKNRSIAKVLEVIVGIAEQTNLLALNAAIEAARAGEQGRGFAVVADEVRTLAQRTQKSTAEIQETIRELENLSGLATAAMAEAVHRATATVDLGHATGTALTGITSQVNTIYSMTEQIASATEQQGQFARDLSESVEKMLSKVAATAKQATNMHGSGVHLNDLAGRLNQVAAQFTVN